MNQQAYWNRAASQKEFTTPFQMDCFKSHVSERSLVLDVGCGYGRTLNALYQEGFENLVGIDFSQKMIERGKKLYPHLDLQLCSSGLPFKDHSIDAVLLIAVLTCIVEDKDQETLVREIERVLTPQGILYVNDFLINQDQRNIDRYTFNAERYGTYGVFELEEGALLRHHTTDHLWNLTRNFRTMEYATLVYTTMNKNTSKGFYYMGQLKHEHPMDWEFKLFNALKTEELYDLLKLRVDVFVVEQNCPYPEVDGKDRHPGTLHLLGKNKEGDLEAYLRILPPGISFKEASIGRVVVAEKSRGKGLCNVMVKKSLDQIRQIWPDECVRIGAQVYLKAFYEVHGFKAVSEPYLEDGILHIDMVR